MNFLQSLSHPPSIRKVYKSPHQSFCQFFQFGISGPPCQGNALPVVAPVPSLDYSTSFTFYILLFTRIREEKVGTLCILIKPFGDRLLRVI